jgi:hypothetical protein
MARQIRSASVIMIHRAVLERAETVDSDTVMNSG